MHDMRHSLHGSLHGRLIAHIARNDFDRESLQASRVAGRTNQHAHRVPLIE
jgi:hypothetical protein